MVLKQPEKSSSKFQLEGIDHLPPQGIPRRKRNGGRRARNKRVNRLCDLPDDVLLHIMNFMDTKDAVRTCVLSKRWKNLCKSLTNLRFYSTSDEVSKELFQIFVSWVMTSRDDSCLLQNLVVDDWVSVPVADMLGKYAVLHGVKQLTMRVICPDLPSFESLPLIFSCHTLTSLKLCVGCYIHYWPTPFVNSPHMPMLKRLHLQYFTFGAKESDRADLFSNFPVLSHLDLRYCYLGGNARVLSICNSSLSSLTLWYCPQIKGYDIVLSTPNLISCTMNATPYHKLSSTCNLPLLEEVKIIDRNVVNTSSVVIGWLQVFANVKLLTITASILELLQEDLSNPNVMVPDPPCLSRLESLEVKRQLPRTISDEEVARAVDHLLQNSSKDKVDVITCDDNFENYSFHFLD